MFPLKALEYRTPFMGYGPCIGHPCLLYNFKNNSNPVYSIAVCRFTTSGVLGLVKKGTGGWFVITAENYQLSIR